MADNLAQQVDAQFLAFGQVIGDDIQAILNMIGDLTSLTTVQKDNLVNAINSIVTSGGAAALTQEIIATANEVGIAPGTVYPPGTLLEALWREVLIRTSIANLSLTGWADLKEVGTSYVNPTFTWTPSGTPENLVLSDSSGVMTNQNVSGNSFATVLTWLFSAYQAVTWTLDGSNTSPITKSTTWVWPTYAGKKTTNVVPNVNEIVAGTKYVIRTNGDVTLSGITTLATEYMWIAIPNDGSQTGAIHTKWYVTALNAGDINANSFIEHRGLVDVNGKNYDVFMYVQSSELLSNLTLKK